MFTAGLVRGGEGGTGVGTLLHVCSLKVEDGSQQPCNCNSATAYTICAIAAAYLAGLHHDKLCNCSLALLVMFPLISCIGDMHHSLDMLLLCDVVSLLQYSF